MKAYPREYGEKSNSQKKKKERERVEGLTGLDDCLGRAAAQVNSQTRLFPMLMNREAEEGWVDGSVGDAFLGGGDKTSGQGLSVV